VCPVSFGCFNVEDFLSWTSIVLYCRSLSAFCNKSGVIVIGLMYAACFDVAENLPW
jgi:hypothetical protein